MQQTSSVSFSSGGAFSNNTAEGNHLAEGSDETSSMFSGLQKNQDLAMPSEKHQFIMNRRRGTAGPLNLKQADLMVQSKLNASGAYPNFI